MQRSLLYVYLLEAQIIFRLIEVVQRRSSPLLVLLRVFLLETIDVLCQLFKHFLFELTLGLARPQLVLDSIRLWLQLARGKSSVEFPSFGGFWRGQGGINVSVCFGRIRKHSLLRFRDSPRHPLDLTAGAVVNAMWES